jgi:hypothetical protein
MKLNGKHNVKRLNTLLFFISFLVIIYFKYL